MHTFSEQWVNLSSVRWVSVPKSRPHSKAAQDLSTVLRSVLVRYLFMAGEAVLTCPCCVETELSISPQALVTVFGTYPGALKQTWTTDI